MSLGGAGSSPHKVGVASQSRQVLLSSHRGETKPAISTMDFSYESIKQAVDGLKTVLPAGFVPQFGIIGGSGLSALEKAIEGPRQEIPYGQIKGFPVSTGKSHNAIQNLREYIHFISWWY